MGGADSGLLRPRTPRRDSIPVAERAVEAMTRVDGRVGVSYGLAEWPADGPTKDSLLRSADERLYAMKRTTSGSGRHATISEGSGVELQRERLACANRLSTRLAPLLEPDQIASATVDELHESFGFHLALVLRVDPDGMMRPVAAAGPLVGE